MRLELPPPRELVAPLLMAAAAALVAWGSVRAELASVHEELANVRQDVREVRAFILGLPRPASTPRSPRNAI